MNRPISKRIFQYSLGFFWFSALVLRFILPSLVLPDVVSAILLVALLLSILYLFFYLLNAQLKGENVFKEQEIIPEPIPSDLHPITTPASFESDNGTQVLEHYREKAKWAIYLSITFLAFALLRGISLLSIETLVTCSIIFGVMMIAATFSIFSSFARVEFGPDGIRFSSPLSGRTNFARSKFVPYDSCKILEALWVRGRKDTFALIFRLNGKRIATVHDTQWTRSYQDIRLEIARRLPAQHYRFGRNSPFTKW